MKKITLAALFLCAIPVSALWEGASPAKVGVADTGVAYLLQPAPLDMADLDVRDAQNRPILAPEATEQLASLFRENLAHLLVFSLPHISAQTNAYMESISHLFNSMMLKRLMALFFEFQEAILPSKPRFVHNVDILWITHFTGLSIGPSLAATICRPSTVTHLPLRC